MTLANQNKTNIMTFPRKKIIRALVCTLHKKYLFFTVD